MHGVKWTGMQLKSVQSIWILIEKNCLFMQCLVVLWVSYNYSNQFRRTGVSDCPTIKIDRRDGQTFNGQMDKPIRQMDRLIRQWMEKQIKDR